MSLREVSDLFVLIKSKHLPLLSGFPYNFTDSGNEVGVWLPTRLLIPDYIMEDNSESS